MNCDMTLNGLSIIIKCLAYETKFGIQFHDKIKRQNALLKNPQESC